MEMEQNDQALEMSNDEKRSAVLAALEEDDSRSNREIAKAAGTGETLVRMVRGSQGTASAEEEAATELPAAEEEWRAHPKQGDAAIKSLRSVIMGLYKSPTAKAKSFKVWFPVILKKQKQGYIPLNCHGDLMGRPLAPEHDRKIIPVDMVIPVEKVNVEGMEVDEEGNVYLFDRGYAVNWNYSPDADRLVGNIGKVFKIDVYRVPASPGMRL